MSLAYILNILKLAGGLAFAGFYYWGIKKQKELESKKKQEQVIAKKTKKSSKVFRAYKILTKFRPTRQFLNKLVKIYAIRIPGDYRRAREEATKMAIVMWSISVGSIIIALITGTGMYGMSCAILASFTICRSIVVSNLEKYDLKIIKELSLFVDDVRHYYYDCKMIPEAVKESIENSKLTLMKQHAQQIYAVLTSDNIIASAKKYNNSITDYYLRMFMATSVVIESYGDRDVNSDSLYVGSLRDLKKDIQIELTKRRTIAKKFKFLSGISVLPYFSLHLIDVKFSGMFTSMHDLYHGSFGSIAKALLFIATFIIFTIISKLRETVRVESENVKFYRRLYNIPKVKQTINAMLNKNWGRSLRLQTLLKKTGNNLDIYTFTTKRMVMFCLAFVIGIVFLLGVKVRNRSAYAQGAINVTQTTSGASDADCYQMYLLTDHYLKQYLKTDWRTVYNRTNGKTAQEFDGDVEKYVQALVKNDLATKGVKFKEETSFKAVSDFLEEFEGTTLSIKHLAGMSYEQACHSDDIMVKSGMKTLRNMIMFASKPNCFSQQPGLADSIAEMVASKVKKVQSQHFYWYDLALAFLFAVGAYFEPLAMMIFAKKALQMDMEDEVIQFESIILILMNIERIAQEDVLEWMCMFSNIFKTSLKKALCNYTLKNDEALDTLCEDEPFEPFRRLIEDIKMVDRNGIYVAFNGVYSDRKNYQEDRKAENEIAIGEKSAFASAIAFASLYAVVVGYITVPLVIASMGDLGSSLGQLQTAASSN